MSRLLPNINKIIGLTGSDLQETHIRAATRALDGQYFKMTIQDSFKPHAICHGVEVFNKITDYRDVIEAICSQ